MKTTIEMTRYYDDGMTSEDYTEISEEQYRDIELISLFLADNYQKSILHKMIRFMNWFYRKVWWLKSK